jgi:hypothetical protein
MSNQNEIVAEIRPILEKLNKTGAPKHELGKLNQIIKRIEEETVCSCHMGAVLMSYDRCIDGYVPVAICINDEDAFNMFGENRSYLTIKSLPIICGYSKNV